MPDLITAAKALCQRDEPPIFGFGMSVNCEEIVWAHLGHLEQYNPAKLAELERYPFWLTGLPDALTEQAVLAAGGTVTARKGHETWRVKKNFRGGVRRRITVEIDNLLVAKGGSVEAQRLQNQIMQAAFIASGFPHSVLIDSGGKSVHAVIYLHDDDDRLRQLDQSGSPLRKNLEQLLFLALGDLDIGVLRSAGREKLTRVPNGTRYGPNAAPVARQTVISVDNTPHTIESLLQWCYGQLCEEAVSAVSSTGAAPISGNAAARKQVRVGGRYRLDVDNFQRTLFGGEADGKGRGDWWYRTMCELTRAGCRAPQMTHFPWQAPPIGQWNGPFLWWVAAYAINHASGGWYFSQERSDWGNGHETLGMEERLRWEDNSEWVADKLRSDAYNTKKVQELYSDPAAQQDWVEWETTHKQLAVNDMIATMEAQAMLVTDTRPEEFDYEHEFTHMCMSSAALKDMPNGEQLQGTLATQTSKTRPIIAKDENNKSLGVAMLSEAAFSGGGGGSTTWPAAEFAASFVANLKSPLRYLHGVYHKKMEKEPFVYFDKYWRPYTKFQVANMAVRAGVPIETETHQKNFLLNVAHNENINYSAHMAPNPFALAFKNGTLYLDKDTGQRTFVPTHNPEDNLRNIFDYDYIDIDQINLLGHAPVWYKAMRNWFPTDAVFIEMCKYIGSVFFDYYFHKDLPFLIGPPDGGKSSFFSMMERVFGEDNTATFTLSELIKKGFILSTFTDKKFVYCPDADQHTKDMSEAINIMKNITGGDKMHVDIKGVQAGSAKFTCKLMIASNAMFSVVDSSSAFWRRLYPLALPTFKGDPDKYIHKDVFNAEMESKVGIIAGYCIGQLSAMIAQKQEDLSRPPEVMELVNEYRVDENPVLQFFNEHMVFTPAAETAITTDAVREAYENWTEPNKRQYIPAKGKFRGLIQGLHKTEQGVVTVVRPRAGTMSVGLITMSKKEASAASNWADRYPTLLKGWHCNYTQHLEENGGFQNNKIIPMPTYSHK